MLRTAIFSFTILMLLTGCSDRSRPEARAVQLSTLDRAASAYPVELAEVRAEEVVEWIRAIGSVRADQRVNLSAEVGGRLAEIGVEVGDRVEKGALLARLDDERLRIARDLARAEVEMARANLEKSKRDAQRQVNLYEDRVTSEYSLDQADLKAQIDAGQLKVTQARLAAAERDLADTSIISPVDGEITRKHVEVGEFVEAGTPLFDIAKIDRVKLVVHVSELEITRLREGAGCGDQRRRASGHRLPRQGEHHQRPGGPPDTRISRRDPGRQRSSGEAASRFRRPRANTWAQLRRRHLPPRGGRRPTRRTSGGLRRGGRYGVGESHRDRLCGSRKSTRHQGTEAGGSGDRHRPAIPAGR